MRFTCYAEITFPDERASEAFRVVDCDCSHCLYEAAKIATGETLAAVIQNELTDSERDALKHYWFDGMKISKIAELSGVSYDYIRRVLKTAEKKIYASLKYVVLHDYMLNSKATLPEEFHFKIVNCINGKELIS